MKPELAIRPATLREARVFFGLRPVPDIQQLYGLFRDDECLALGGVTRDPDFQGTLLEPDARDIGFLDVKEVPAGWEVPMARAVLRILCEIGGPVYVQRDDTYPQSGRLLKWLGFKRLNTTERDRRTGEHLEIWKWQD